MVLLTSKRKIPHQADYYIPELKKELSMLEKLIKNETSIDKQKELMFKKDEIEKTISQYDFVGEQGR